MHLHIFCDCSQFFRSRSLCKMSPPPHIDTHTHWDGNRGPFHTICVSFAALPVQVTICDPISKRTVHISVDPLTLTELSGIMESSLHRLSIPIYYNSCILVFLFIFSILKYFFHFSLVTVTVFVTAELIPKFSFSE